MKKQFAKFLILATVAVLVLSGCSKKPAATNTTLAEPKTVSEAETFLDKLNAAVAEKEQVTKDYQAGKMSGDWFMQELGRINEDIEKYAASLAEADKTNLTEKQLEAAQFLLAENYFAESEASVSSSEIDDLIDKLETAVYERNQVTQDYREGKFSGDWFMQELGRINEDIEKYTALLGEVDQTALSEQQLEVLRLLMSEIN